MKRLALQTGLIVLGFLLGSAASGSADSQHEIGRYQISVSGENIYRVDTATGYVCRVEFIYSATQGKC